MISGNLEAKLWAGAFLGGLVLLGLAFFVLLPAGLIALINWSERRAYERLRRQGVRCQVLVKSYRRVSMTQHRVLFELHLPEGRLGREYMLSGLSDADLANWTVLQVPLAAYAHMNATTIALDVAPPSASRSWFPALLGASIAVALVVGLAAAAMHSDDEEALGPELRALCAALRSRRIDVANVRLIRRMRTGVIQRAAVDLDDRPYEIELLSAAASTPLATQCVQNGSISLCASSDSRTGYETRPVSPRVRAAFAASAK